MVRGLQNLGSKPPEELGDELKRHMTLLATIIYSADDKVTVEHAMIVAAEICNEVNKYRLSPVEGAVMVSNDGVTNG